MNLTEPAEVAHLNPNEDGPANRPLAREQSEAIKAVSRLYESAKHIQSQIGPQVQIGRVTVIRQKLSTHVQAYAFADIKIGIYGMSDDLI